MNSRERMLTALSNGRPDRLPCQVHGWMDYYLKHYSGWHGLVAGVRDVRHGLRHLRLAPLHLFANRDLAKWRPERKDLGVDADGNHRWEETITTPKGDAASRRRVERDHRLGDRAADQDRTRLRALGRVTARCRSASTSRRSRRPRTGWATGASSAATRSAPARAARGRASARWSARAGHHDGHGHAATSLHHALERHPAEDAARHRDVGRHAGRHGRDRRRRRLQHRHQPRPCSASSACPTTGSSTRPCTTPGVKIVYHLCGGADAHAGPGGRRTARTGWRP